MRCIPEPQGWEINETKGVHSLERSIKWTKEKREKTQITNVGNVAGDADTDPMDIKRKIRKYHLEFFTHKTKNSDKGDQFFGKHRLLQLIQCEVNS